MATYDVIVIGGGPAGEVAAGRLSLGGATVALVESELVGGECAFYACMPSKALLRPGHALAEALRVPGAAEAVSRGVDAGATLARRDEVISRLDDSGHLPWLEERGVTLIRGRGQLDGNRRVRVGADVHEAAQAVIVAVGSEAAMPPIPGLAQARPWTNREATTSERIPEHLIVLGGGAAGAELADAYCALGARVTLIEAAERLLPHEEPFAGDELAAALAARGVELRVGVRAERVSRNGTVTVSLSDGPDAEGDELLVAVGRRPRTDDIGLETVGLMPGKPIPVDEHLRVPGLPWLYALGDVNGRALLTHVAKYQARVAADLIAGRRTAGLPRDGGVIARVVFTEPEVAAVGLTLEAAGELGMTVRAYDVPTAGTPGASFEGRGVAGTSRIVVDEARQILVGATFVGPGVADWLHAATIAIICHVPIAQLWEAVAPFPTRSEIWLKLLERRDAELASAR